MEFQRDTLDLIHGTARIIPPQPRNDHEAIRMKAEQFDIDLWMAGSDWFMSVWDREGCRIRVHNMGSEARDVYLTAQRLLKSLGCHLIHCDKLKVTERNRLHDPVSWRWESGLTHREMKHKNATTDT